MFKLACTNTMVPGTTLTEKADILKECGFDAMSVFLDIAEWTLDTEDELLHLEQNTGIKVCEFCFGGGLYGHLMDPDREIRKAAIEIYEQTIEIGNKLNSISEMEYQYYPRSPIPLLDVYLKLSPEEKDYYCELYKRLAEQVTGDAMLLLEPINRYEEPYLNTIADNIEIIDRVNTPRTGILFDTYHINMEERDLVDTFKKYHKYVRHVHMGDNNRLLPGKGNLPWARFFETLNEYGYDGFCNLECAIMEQDVKAELKKTVNFIHALSR